MSEAKHEEIRDRYHIMTEGEEIPPPLEVFEVSLQWLHKFKVTLKIIINRRELFCQDMKLPKAIIAALHKKGIRKPTPIQMQGLPVV